MNRVVDLTNMKFGRLTVIERVENKRGNSCWLCKCDCGNVKEVLGWCLKSEHTKSCGCLQKESISLTGKLLKKNNIYDISGCFGIGYTFKNEMFYFDLEDYDIIKCHCWHQNNNGYIATKIDGKIQMQHRIIINPNKNKTIDHINHNKTDNRKENLRICTQHENMMNVSISNRNKSGIRGVYWNNAMGKWHVQISNKNKKIHIGLFNNIEDATSARIEAEIKYQGEFRNNDKEMGCK